MRKLILFVVPFLLTACFPFDKIPEVEIKIDNSAISTIDSLEIYLLDSYTDNEHEEFKVYTDNKEYKFLSHAQNAIIKITLKDRKQIRSKTLKLGEFKNRIIISKVDKKYVFEKKVESKIIKYGSIFLILFTIVFISKIPMALLIINPELKKDFILKYGGLNLAYLAVIGILFAVFKDSYILFLYPSYLIIIILDLLFLIKFYKERGKTRPIIAGIVCNLMFLTIGQLAITFAIMMTV